MFGRGVMVVQPVTITLLDISFCNMELLHHSYSIGRSLDPTAKSPCLLDVYSWMSAWTNECSHVSSVYTQDSLRCASAGVWCCMREWAHNAVEKPGWLLQKKANDTVYSYSALPISHQEEWAVGETRSHENKATIASVWVAIFFSRMPLVTSKIQP